MLSINTQSVSYGLTVFDPQNATNKPLFSNLFEKGVSTMGSATWRTTAIEGLTGYYGVKAIYSTREGRTLSEIIPPPGMAPTTEKGSWYVGLSAQQYVLQDQNDRARGWGVFGEIAKADGNPNYHDWSIYFGIGGTSPFPGRSHDRFGVGYFHFGFSDLLKDEVAPVFRLRDQSGARLSITWH